MANPIFQFADGSTLNPTVDPIPNAATSGGPFTRMDPIELRNYVGTLWQEAFESKRAETERLKRNSLYYDGFHYQNAWQNRVNPIANYCFSVVETVVPAMTEARPRPEIIPRSAGMNEVKINQLADAANWIMDVTNWDLVIQLGARDKCIYGWNVWLVTFQFATGMPFAKNLSVFDVYVDPSARNEDEAEYFFLATAISTAKLQATYPHLADQIRADGVASPSHPVIVQPWQEYLDGTHRYEAPTMLESALPFHKEADAPISGSVSLTISTGEARTDARTTMVFQLFHRDDSLEEVTYVGTLTQPDGTKVPGMHHVDKQACCRSGWRLIVMTAQGVILDNRPLDECYGGPPIVFDFDYRRTDRFWSMGETDNVIPLQRRDNRRSALLQRAVELAMNPPVVTNRDSGLAADKGTVNAGEVLRITRGSELKYLEFRAPIDTMVGLQLQDGRVMDSVTGVQDVQQGIRPAGIEAAAAIRRLQEAAQVRVRGKETQAISSRGRLLKKLMVCAGKKLQANIGFKGSKGAFINLNPEDLLAEYDIRFAEGSGTIAGREGQKEDAFTLYQAGAIDEQELLTAYDWKNRDEVVKRIQMRKMQEAIAAAQAQQAQGGSPNGAKGGSRKPPQTARAA